MEDFKTKMEAELNEVKAMIEASQVAQLKNRQATVLNQAAKSYHPIAWISPPPKDVFGITTWASLESASIAQLRSLLVHYHIDYPPEAQETALIFLLRDYLRS